MVLRGCDLGIEHCEVLVVAHLSHLVSEEIGESRAIGCIVVIPVPFVSSQSCGHLSSGDRINVVALEMRGGPVDYQVAISGIQSRFCKGLRRGSFCTGYCWRRWRECR